MKVWRIETTGDAREIYSVEAETEEEAIEKLERGDAHHHLTEVTGLSIESIDRID